ncbi:protein kinase, putative [Trypanosoma equiperdum]|uniref:mitogen-activated protein kinase kinase n=1 Tax=Trypanosoma equiperdum TaxID=5694 RepID=A0A1G4I9F8_TRYEQ|nr:protein kinase, putative [Trypanosoma equiperdum]
MDHKTATVDGSIPGNIYSCTSAQLHNVTSNPEESPSSCNGVLSATAIGRQVKQRPPPLFSLTPPSLLPPTEPLHIPSSLQLTAHASSTVTPKRDRFQQLRPPLLNRSACSTAAGASVASLNMLAPEDFFGHHPRAQWISLSDDGQHLHVGPFIVSGDGCLTMESVLQLNANLGIHGGEVSPAPLGSHGRRSVPGALLKPKLSLTTEPLSNNSFTLLSTSLDTPYSPITYSLNAHNAKTSGFTTPRPTFAAAGGDSATHTYVMPSFNLPSPSVLPPNNADSSSSNEPGLTAVKYSDVKLKSIVGEGASANVYMAEHYPTGKLLAVKRIDLSSMIYGWEHMNICRTHSVRASPYIRQLHRFVLRELQTLHMAYRNPFMVKVYNAFFNKEEMALDFVMEYMHYGGLDRLQRLLGGYVTDNDVSNGVSTGNDVNCQVVSAGGSRTKKRQNQNGGTHGARRRNRSNRHNGDGAVCMTEEKEMRESEVDAKDERKVVSVPERLVAVVGEQLLRGVEHMHSRGFVHRDIKPGNVLINNRGIVKLGDFGLSSRCTGEEESVVSLPHFPADFIASGDTGADVKIKSRDDSCEERRCNPRVNNKRGSVDNGFESDAASNMSGNGYGHSINGIHTGSGYESPPLVGVASASESGAATGDDPQCSGTSKYMSPERQRGRPHGKPSDIWAVGMTLAEFAVGQYPVDLTDCADPFVTIHRMEEPLDLRRFPRDVPLSDAFLDFIHSCMDPEPRRRPTARELLSHPFFRQWTTTFSIEAYLELHTAGCSNLQKR